MTLQRVTLAAGQDVDRTPNLQTPLPVAEDPVDLDAPIIGRKGLAIFLFPTGQAAFPHFFA